MNFIFNLQSACNTANHRAMSERLRKLIAEYVLKAGKGGMAKLSIESSISIRTLADIKAGHIPLPSTVLQLARACGLNEKRASALARECSKSRESA